MRAWQGLSIFSGIGGLDLAFEWAGGEVSAMCEIEPYCRKVLHKHWPDVPLFEDIRRLKGTDVGTVDVIYGGFPCQPFSVAGNKRGKDDSRYLWPEFSRLVGEIKPRWVVAENVPGILHLAADDVCSDLEHKGYEVGIWDFEAASVGAKHRRERIFFVAHSRCTLRQGRVKQGTLRNEVTEGTSHKPERSDCPYASDTNKVRCYMRRFEGQRVHGLEPVLNEADTGCETAAYTACTRCERNIRLGLQEAHSAIGLRGRWESEPCVDRVANGIPNRVDRLRALGNAVVPQQAYPVFKAIMDADEQDEQSEV